LKSKTSAAIILIVLFLIALILVITFAGFPQTQSQVYNLTTNTSELRFEWLQNDKYTLDASKFFIDQDNNTLHYNMTGLQNIKSIVNSNVITLYPNLGWSGTEHGRIVAYDNYGTSTPSPNMTFIVRSVPRKGVLELYNIYCTYVNLVIFALVLILVFVMVFVKQKVRKRK